MHPVSIRFRNPAVRERLHDRAAAAGQSLSAFTEELVDEGLRVRDHPLIVFRDGPTGRRAGLISGPDVWEVVGGVVGGDVAPGTQIARAADLLNIPVSHIEAALRYYAEYPVEVDARIETNRQTAERELRLWERRQSLAGHGA